MRKFSENQAFRQWWMLFIMGLALIGSCLVLINSYDKLAPVTSKFIAFGVVVLIIILFWVLQLNTKIDGSGIKAEFEPINISEKILNGMKLANAM
ncbi:hypothetical protein [Christiangramia sp.]|uniref:hypothetical protein n=1 Tax=Christiangramia sp. TaxID=1931228 RepID=UPI0026208421|nr:hypothetical protein [Christiangramia sp.]